MEVIKIRLQAQHHSMADPLDIPKYRNAAHALYTVVKEEGIGALYRGISLTALRQGMFPCPSPNTITHTIDQIIMLTQHLHRIQPSGQLHRIHQIQGDPAGLAAAVQRRRYP